MKLFVLLIVLVISIGNVKLQYIEPPSRLGMFQCYQWACCRCIFYIVDLKNGTIIEQTKTPFYNVYGAISVNGDIISTLMTNGTNVNFADYSISRREMKEIYSINKPGYSLRLEPWGYNSKDIVVYVANKNTDGENKPAIWRIDFGIGEYEFYTFDYKSYHAPSGTYDYLNDIYYLGFKDNINSNYYIEEYFGATNTSKEYIVNSVSNNPKIHLHYYQGTMYGIVSNNSALVLYTIDYALDQMTPIYSIPTTSSPSTIVPYTAYGNYLIFITDNQNNVNLTTYDLITRTTISTSQLSSPTQFYKGNQISSFPMP